MKECKDCGEEKSETEFYVLRKSTGGLSSYCRACHKVRNHRGYHGNKETRQAAMRAYRARLRQTVLDAYGAQCVCCGEEQNEFLTVDHVNNDGAEHRRQLGVPGGALIYRDIIKRGFPDTFQILCFNCNSAKAIYGTCPHQVANYSYGRSQF